MTSGELLNKRFEKAMGGYKTTEVEAFLTEAANAFTQLTRENGDLKRQLEALRVQTADMEADKDSLRDALLSAQKFADSLVHDAKAQAETILAEARTKADRLTGSVQIQIVREKEELTRVKTEVAAFRSKLLDIYRAHLELIGAMPVEVPEGKTEPAQAESETPADGIADASAEMPAAVPADPEKAAQSAAQVEAAAQATADAVPSGGAATLGHTVPVRLNMRYDEQTGEYVPFSQGNRQEEE